MAGKISAGILLYRRAGKHTEVFLVHPGGPFWKHKDEGAWSLPKGEVNGEEDMLAAAKREFKEETGQEISGHFVALEPVVQKAGKKVYAWAVAGDIDTGDLRSNTFLMEWPPKSGRRQEWPEVDKWEWFTVAEARGKINAGQTGFLDQLAALV